MTLRPALFIYMAFAGCAVGTDPADENDGMDEGIGETESPRLVASAAPCGAGKLAEVLAPATTASRSVALDCSLTLRPTDRVTRQIILEGAAASGVTLDCVGAVLDGGDGTVNAGRDMIEIRSRRSVDAAGVPSWERPESITVKNCDIRGSVRIWGMGKNGEAADVRASSRVAGHVTRVRGAAPRRILLDNLTITGVGRTPLYLSPGVSEVTLIGSELTGEATSVGLYLDTESTRNVIRNNYLHVTSRQEYVGGIYTRKREEIAVDNSSYNKIIDNRLSSLEGGGIYLYRNCGEGGTVRHGTPSYNQIINNVFYYNEYSGDNPAIFVGSRDNTFWEGRWYCGDDAGYAWGSSVDDRSFAQHTVVMQNQIFKRSLSDMIQHGDTSNRPSYVAYNTTVTTEVMRPAGCYVASGYKSFIVDGEKLDVFRGSAGEPRCTGYQVTCHDGDLTTSTTSACSLVQSSFECMVGGTNLGCERVASCPAGRRIVGAVAACNLEYGAVSDAQLASVPAGSIQVAVPSDNVSEGTCHVGPTHLSSGRATLAGIADASGVSIGCRERDDNGGDCHVRGVLICR